PSRLIFDHPNGGGAGAVNRRLTPAHGHIRTVARMRRHAIPLSLAAIAVAVRLPHVWTRPLSQDEVFSARILDESSLPRALHRIVRTESTPPLWYLLGWVVHHLGAPVVDARLLSVAFGVGMTLLVHSLARRALSAWRLAVAGGAALAAPWLPAFVAQYRHDHFWWIGRFAPRVVATTPLTLFLPYGPRQLGLGVAAFAIAALGLVALWRRSAAGRLFALM